MRSLSPVVWYEGMYLGPHHFQAQSRYFEDYIRFAVSLVSFGAFGVKGYRLNADALESGRLVLDHARGVFPDGLVFQIPESDAAPPDRSIAADFPPTREKLIVSLAIPSYRAGHQNCSLLGTTGSDTRLIAESRALPDETNGIDEKPVELGRKNIRFRLETEDAPSEERIPIARLMRSRSGRIVEDPSFVPPCLDFSASRQIMTLLKRLIDILKARSSSMSLAAGQQPSFAPQDVAQFWLLHTINSSVAQLGHLYSSKHGHPEDLYVEMLRLGGALCTFTLNSDPGSLPPYNHLALHDCFDALDAHIREHLQIIFPDRCISVALQSEANYFYYGSITDERCLGRSSWILAVRGGGGDANVIGRVPALVKICSRAFVPELVKRALPGFELRHLSTPPDAIRVLPDAHYFAINKAGPCWDHIVKTQQVGIYVPGEFPSPEVELLVILS